MYITPVIPTLPVVTPVLFPVKNISCEAAIAVLSAFLFIAAAMICGWLLTKIMTAKNLKTSLAVNLSLSGVMALALFLRYGMTATILQGLAFIFVLLFASCLDITSHTMDDYLWVMVLCLGLCSIPTVGLTSMLIGAAMVFIPQMLLAWLPPHKTLGGADIKLSTAIAFLLGWQRGLAALLLGLFTAVIVMSIVGKVRKEKTKQPFALIPFLAGAAVLLFLV